MKPLSVYKAFLPHTIVLLARQLLELIICGYTAWNSHTIGWSFFFACNRPQVYPDTSSITPANSHKEDSICGIRTVGNDQVTYRCISTRTCWLHFGCNRRELPDPNLICHYFTLCTGCGHQQIKKVCRPQPEPSEQVLWDNFTTLGTKTIKNKNFTWHILVILTSLLNNRFNSHLQMIFWKWNRCSSTSLQCLWKKDDNRDICFAQMPPPVTEGQWWDGNH